MVIPFTKLSTQKLLVLTSKIDQLFSGVAIKIKRGLKMQMHHTETQVIDDDLFFYTPKKKSNRSRKWREIEDIKARQKLSRELREIDQSFVFLDSLN